MTGLHPPRPTRSVSGTFAVLAGGEAAARLMAFASTILLARRLGASSFGVLSVAMAVRLYLSAVVEGGIDSVGMREVSIRHGFTASVAPALVLVRLAVAVIVVLLTAGIALSVVPGLDGVLIAAYALTLLPFALNLRWLRLGLGDPGSAALARLIGEAIVLAAVAFLVKSPADLGRMPAAQFAADSAAAALLVLLSAGQLGPLSRRAFSIARPFFRESSHLVIHSVFGLVIFNADLLILRVLRTPAEVGQYAAAYAIAGFLVNLGVMYYQSLLPALAGAAQSRDAMVGRYGLALEQVLAVALPIAAGGVVVAAPLMTALFGSAYGQSGIAFAILVVSIPASWLRNVAQAGQVAGQRADLLLKASAIAATINVSVNLIMIPRFGLIGAAGTTLLTEIVRTAIALKYSSGIGLAPPGLGRFWRPLIATGVMVPVVLATASLPLWARVLLGAGSYAVAMIPLGGFRRLVG